jgi:hypothetical protein
MTEGTVAPVRVGSVTGNAYGHTQNTARLMSSNTSGSQGKRREESFAMPTRSIAGRPAEPGGLAPTIGHASPVFCAA